MFDQQFNQLLNNIHNNQIQQLNLITPAPQRETSNVAHLQTWEGHTNPVRALAVLHDGSLVSASGDTTLRHWDPQSGQCLSTWTGHTAAVRALAVLHDGSVVSASDDTTLRHWDPQSGQCLSTWTGHTSAVYALAVLPDGSAISASADKTLRHWDPQSGQCLSTWTGHTRNVYALAVLHDGSVVSASEDKTLRHWDPQSGQCLSTWAGHTDYVRALAVLPDGSVISASEDKTLRHWDPQSGQCLSTWMGHTDYVYALAVLPDGSVVSGSKDNTLRRWGAQSGQCLSTWIGHTSAVYALSVLPDGSVVSASDDNALRHWPAPPMLVSLEQVEGVLGALKDNRSLQSLALSGPALTHDPIQALAQLIVKHPHLSSIALESCDLTDENIQPLLNGFKNPDSRVNQFTAPNNPELSQEAHTALQRVVEYRSAGCPAPEWTEAQAKDISALLNNTLEQLDWNGAPLTQAHVLELTAALTMNHSLRTLSLDDTQVDTLGVQFLAQMLKTHPQIRKLLLDENLLKEEGVSALLDLFEQHTSLYRVAAAGAGATKAQRQQLNAYNKQHRIRKKQPTLLPAAADESVLPPHIYDRAWEGQQIMAEPVFSCALGKVVEKERLGQFGDAALFQEPVVGLLQVESHIRETVTATQPHAWHEGTVYLPTRWRREVLEAIQAGEDNVLAAYWERHPGLVTHHYETEEGPMPVYRLLMNARRQGAFAQWLEYYSRYHNDDQTLPSIATWFTQVDQGQHALHHLIHAVDAKEQERWFREVRFDLGVTGGVYHGLVHLHGPETLEADNQAIEHLVAQGLLPTEADKEGYTPLMRAVMEEHYALAELLLPYSEAQALDKGGNTALHHLAKAKPSEGREHCIVKLLTLGGDNNLPNQAGETPRGLLEASIEGETLGQYEVLVHTAKLQHDRYVKRLENTIALLLEQAEKGPIEKSSAEPLLKSGLLDEKGWGKTYLVTMQRLHQLFFNAEPAVESQEEGEASPLRPPAT